MQRFIILGISTFFFWLAGCATTTPQQPASERMQTEGLVTATLVTNTSMITHGIRSFRWLEVEHQQTGRKYQLYRGEGLYPYANTVQIAGWLPAGDFKLRALKSSYAAISAHFMLGKFNLNFSVQAGQVHDLNTLVYQPVGEGQTTLVQMASTPEQVVLNRAMGDAREQLSTRPPHEVQFTAEFPLVTDKISATSEGLGLIASVVTSLSSTAGQVSEQQQWHTIDTEADLLALVKRSTTSLNGKARLPDGRWLFGSQLGQLQVRTADGQWQNIDTGIAAEITAVAYHDGHVFASTDNGQLLTSDVSLAHWSAISLPDAEQSIVAMLPLQATQLALVSRSGKNLYVSLLNGRPDSLPPASFQAPFPAGNPLVAQIAIPQGVAAVVSGELWLRVADREVAIYTPDTGEWSRRKLDKSFVFLRASEDGTVVIAGAPGVFNTHMISSDGGKHFRKQPGASLLADMQFVSDTQGFALENEMGAFSATNLFAATTDGGKTWTRGEALPEPCADWHVLNEVMLCVTQGGSILSSRTGEDLVAEKLVQ